MKIANRLISESNRQLELIILPTEKCNFRCTYCYESFEIGKMTIPVKEAIKSFISKRIELGLDLLRLTWFGGEPLLAKEIILDISEHAHKYRASGKLGALIGSLTTNAFLLTGDILEKLVTLNQKQFQISLDGYGDGHDETRKYASGKGTFGVIWKNLLEAKSSKLDFHIVLRLHITNNNASSLEALAKEICKELNHDERFSILLKRIVNLGGENGEKLIPVDYLRAGNLAKKLNAEFLKSGIKCVDGTLDEFESAIDNQSGSNSENSNMPGYVCYASKPNSLMIRPDGRIGKCTVVFDDPLNTVGKINTDGSLFFDQAKMGFWLRGILTRDPITLGCPARR